MQAGSWSRGWGKQGLGSRIWYLRHVGSPGRMGPVERRGCGLKRGVARELDQSWIGVGTRNAEEAEGGEVTPGNQDEK